MIAAPIWRCSCDAETASPSTPGIVLTPAPEIFTLASFAGRSTDAAHLVDEADHRGVGVLDRRPAGPRRGACRSASARSARRCCPCGCAPAPRRPSRRGRRAGAPRAGRASTSCWRGGRRSAARAAAGSARSRRARACVRAQAAEGDPADLDPWRDLVRPRVVVGVQRAPQDDEHRQRGGDQDEALRAHRCTDGSVGTQVRASQPCKLAIAFMTSRPRGVRALVRRRASASASGSSEGSSAMSSSASRSS